MKGLGSILPSLGVAPCIVAPGRSILSVCVFCFGCLRFFNLIKFSPIPCLFCIGSFNGFVLRCSWHCFSRGFLAFIVVAVKCCFAVDRFSCHLNLASGGKFGFVGFFWRHSSVFATSSPGYTAVVGFFWHSLMFHKCLP